MVISHSPPSQDIKDQGLHGPPVPLQDLKTVQGGHATGVTSNIHLALTGSKASFPA